jgi:small subunit ribosomal protein S1
MKTNLKTITQTSFMPEGKLLLTQQNYARTKNIESLIKAMDEQAILEGRAVLCDSHHNLHVELGTFKGIIPADECVYSSFPVKDVAIISRVGKSVSFVITDITIGERGEPFILLSRAKAQKQCIDEYISKLKSGDIINAKVTHLETFGCFVDIGCGVISLLSIDTMSVSRISHPKERFYPGEMINVVIKTPADETGRVTLTHKELLGTWEENASLFSVGETVSGPVRSIESYGVFIELTPNLAGLAEYKEGISAGQIATVYIKSIIKEKMKIKLVIVDCVQMESTRPKYEYFITEGHIDHWVYSPKESDRIIETIFGKEISDDNY